MELKHQEIAETLGITIENVKVRLHRARKKLKTILEEKCTFEKDERNVLVCNPIDCGPKEPKGVIGKKGDGYYFQNNGDTQKPKYEARSRNIMAE
jgi:hypothetical protein